MTTLTLAPDSPSASARRTPWLLLLGAAVGIMAACFVAVLAAVFVYAAVLAIANAGAVDTADVDAFAAATGDRMGPALRVLFTFLVARHLACSGRLGRFAAVAFAMALVLLAAAIGAMFGEIPVAIDIALGVTTVGASMAGQRFGERDHRRTIAEQTLTLRLRGARSVDELVRVLAGHWPGSALTVWSLDESEPRRLGGTDTAALAAMPDSVDWVACGAAHGVTLREAAPGERRQLRSVAETIGLTLERIALQTEARQQGARDERERLAGDIHDTIAQDLGGAAAHLEAATAAMPAQDAAAGRHVRVAGDSVRSALGELRGLVWALRPGDRRLSLVEAMRRSIDRANHAGVIAVHAELPETATGLGPDAEVGLLRGLQELLHNAERHANATRVDVRLVAGPDAVELNVTDDGTGFTADVSALPDAGSGHGLSLLRDRARRLGGTLEVAAGTTGGSRVTLRLPRHNRS